LSAKLQKFVYKTVTSFVKTFFTALIWYTQVDKKEFALSANEKQKRKHIGIKKMVTQNVKWATIMLLGFE
jgi:hypothetical protein